MKYSTEIEQALRRSHCSHPDAHSTEHRCVGTCKITPKGTELECALCGTDSIGRYRNDVDCAKLLGELLREMGIQPGTLSDESINRGMAKLLETYCPGCGLRFVPDRFNDYLKCECGWFRSRGNWKSENEA